MARTNPDQDAEYMRRWRAKRPERREQERASNRASHRALWALARLHPQDFERLQDSERAIEGLPPIHTTKRGRPTGPASKEPTNG